MVACVCCWSGATVTLANAKVRMKFVFAPKKLSKHETFLFGAMDFCQTPDGTYSVFYSIFLKYLSKQEEKDRKQSEHTV